MALVGISFGYLGIVLFLPALNVFYQAFRNGVGPFLFHLTDPDFLQAVPTYLSLSLALLPYMPLHLGVSKLSSCRYNGGLEGGGSVPMTIHGIRTVEAGDIG